MNTTSILPEGRMIKNRYKIIKILGTGGMGSVYLAEDKERDGLLVAVKEMHKISDPVERAKDIGQFGKEARFLTNLNHPNLPDLYEFFLEDDVPYLVMEYIEGETLQKILEDREKPLEEKIVLQWAVQICEVLNYLHTGTTQPIIFRDLKLSNILIDKNNGIKLIDFGIAREFNPRKHTDTIRMGSVGYAPPEQYAKGGQTDVRTDIYALGVCLHALLTRNEPSATPFSFEEVIKINPEVSPGLNNIIKKALEIKPEKRYQSSFSMLEEIKKIIPGAGIRITPDFIDLGEIATGEERSFTAVISNIKKGFLSGCLKGDIPSGISLSFTSFKGNYQELTVDVDTSGFEAGKNYSQIISFTSNGGEANIIISFSVILPPTHIEADVSFLDFGTLKYGEETAEVITIYNEGGGKLKGEIASPEKWLSFSTGTIDGNETKIKVSVNSSLLPEGKSSCEGTINITSNGGDITISAVVFQPVLHISPSVINIASISSKKKKEIPLKVANRGRGYLRGTVTSKSPAVNLSPSILSGNNNYIDVSIDTGKLKKGKKEKLEIKIDTNGGLYKVPVIIGSYFMFKGFLKYFISFFILLLMIFSYHIYRGREEKIKALFLSNLGKIKADIVYYYKTNDRGKIYTIRPDGTEKKIIAPGFSPLPSPDGEKLLFYINPGEIEVLELSSGKIIKLIKGFNPLWSCDGRKIAFEREDGIIYIAGKEDYSEIEPLIYGKSPSWHPSGNKIVYDDGKDIDSSIKLISLNDRVPEVLCSGFKPLWSPDGTGIVYNLEKNKLAVMDMSLLSTEITFEGQNPVWSSDGKKIAFYKDEIIYIIYPETGEKKKVGPGVYPSWSPDDKYLAFRGIDGIYIMGFAEEMKYMVSSKGYYPLFIPRQDK